LVEKHLNAAERNDLPDSDFALPGRRYPLNDKNHAKDALARASANASPAEKKKIRAKVHAKYPDMKIEEDDDMMGLGLDETQLLIDDEDDMPDHDPNVDTVKGDPHWASYFVNGDDSGLDDDEIALADKWYEDNVPEGWSITDVSDEPEFSWSYGMYTGDPHAKGGELVDYTIYNHSAHSAPATNPMEQEPEIDESKV
jgi:hypothetical protein